MFDIDDIGSTLLKLGVGVAATAGLFLLVDTLLDDEGCGSNDNDGENEETEGSPDEMSRSLFTDAHAAKAAKAAKATEVDDDDDDEADDEDGKDEGDEEEEDEEGSSQRV